MRPFTSGGIIVRGLTPEEKAAAWPIAKQRGCSSLSTFVCLLIREAIQKPHRKDSTLGQLPADRPMSVTRKIKQAWRIPGQEPKKKNSPKGRPAQHSPAAVHDSGHEEDEP